MASYLHRLVFLKRQQLFVWFTLFISLKCVLLNLFPILWYLKMGTSIFQLKFKRRGYKLFVMFENIFLISHENIFGFINSMVSLIINPHLISVQALTVSYLIHKIVLNKIGEYYFEPCINTSYIIYEYDFPKYSESNIRITCILQK